MNTKAKKVAQFGLLVALSLVLGYFDRAVPLSALLGGAIPGMKLGLANTVLLYAIYLMDWKSSLLLMMAKVVLSGFMFGSLNAMLYSLAGGLLSMGVMLLVRKRPAQGALGIALVCAVCEAMLISRVKKLWSPLFWCAVLIGAALIAALIAFFVIRKHPEFGVLGTSLAGAVAHNLGQVLVAALMLRTPQLLYTYLPILAGIGAAVGSLTGLIAQRVFHALRLKPEGT